MPGTTQDGVATYHALKDLRPHNAGPLRTVTGVDAYVGTARAAPADVYAVLEGVGTLHSRLGYVFRGSLRAGEPTGHGVLRWADGRTVVGSFANGTVDGSGTLRWPNGDTYTGGLRRSVRHGSGTLVFAGGAARYDGEWCSGRREGEGVQHYANGSVYSGEWRGNARHGRGTLRYPTGDVYEGAWEADVPAGHGAMAWADPSRTFFKELYVGEWRNGVPEGSGQSTYISLPAVEDMPGSAAPPLPLPSAFLSPAEARLNVYAGSYSGGQRSGHGVFYYADGSCWEGKWAAGEKCGPGRFTSAVGQVREGEGDGPDTAAGEDAAALAVVPTASPVGLGSLLESVDDLTVTLRNLLHRHNTALRQLFQLCCRLQANVALPSTRRDWWQQRLPGRAAVVQCLALLHRGRVLGPAFTIGDALRAAVDVVAAEEGGAAGRAAQLSRAEGTLDFRQFCEWTLRVAAGAVTGAAAPTLSAKVGALLGGALRPAVLTTPPRAAVAAAFLPHSLRFASEVQAELPVLTHVYAELQRAEGGDCGCVALRTTLAAVSSVLRQRQLTPSLVVHALAWLQDRAAMEREDSGESSRSTSLSEELRAAAMVRNRTAQHLDEDAEATQSFVEFVETVMTMAALVQEADGTPPSDFVHQIRGRLFAM